MHVTETQGAVSVHGKSTAKGDPVVNTQLPGKREDVPAGGVCKGVSVQSRRCRARPGSQGGIPQTTGKLGHREQGKGSREIDSITGSQKPQFSITFPKHGDWIHKAPAFPCLLSVYVSRKRHGRLQRPSEEHKPPGIYGRRKGSFCFHIYVTHK